MTPKILLVGPELVPPWSEGRKNFVRDLAAALPPRAAVRLVTTAAKGEEIRYPCTGTVIGARSKLRQLTSLDRALRRAVEVWAPDAVCHFPYGTFHGVRGRANLWSISRIDRSCARLGVRCLTIPYSITKGSRTRLSQRVRELVSAPASNWTGLTVTLGIDLSRSVGAPRRREERPTVLFMAGVATSGRHLMPYVLTERGLADLIAAGPQLATVGARVIVAIPALSDTGFRDELRHRFAMTAPNLEVDLRPAVTVPEIFSEADLYVFPYRVELEQFVPTSILEAMGAGVPVVLSDLPMLAALANSGQTAFRYPAGDGRALGEVLVAALGDEAGRAVLAASARALVVAQWSIERSVDDLLGILFETKN